MIASKLARDLETGDRVWWADSDTGPLSLAEVVGATDLGARAGGDGGFLAGRIQIAVRLRDSSVRRAVRAAEEELLVDEPVRAPKKAPAAASSSADA